MGKHKIYKHLIKSSIMVKGIILTFSVPVIDPFVKTESIDFLNNKTYKN